LETAVSLIEERFLTYGQTARSSSLPSSSLIIGFLSPGAYPLEPTVHPLPHSGFKFQTVALSLLRVMSLIQLHFVENLLNASLVVFTDIFVDL
jgi:hypothetical protein